MSERTCATCAYDTCPEHSARRVDCFATDARTEWTAPDVAVNTEAAPSGDNLANIRDFIMDLAKHVSEHQAFIGDDVTDDVLSQIGGNRAFVTFLYRDLMRLADRVGGLKK
jgi:hypothetical protein